MNDFEEVIRALEPYLSQPNARALMLKALRDQKVAQAAFTLGDLRKISAQLERGLSLFIGRAESARAVRQLSELGAKGISNGPSTFAIDSETDISTARAAARRICADLGCKSLATQKVTTIVSELARNIISYTNGGVVEIVVITAGQRRIVVRAVDKGPGIANLPLIMSGKYQSRTGLGRGLSGSKRLADEFDISTSASGTRVVAEVLV
jgi:serine/threonine-protein kinase RsbT